MKHNSKVFSLPNGILDFSFLLMIIFMAQASTAHEEYQTKVDLLKKRQQNQEMGIGTDVLSVAVQKQLNGYGYAIESEKLGVKSFNNLPTMLDELKRLAPPEMLLRVDKTASFSIPQEIMIFAHNHNINLGFAYTQEAGK